MRAMRSRASSAEPCFTPLLGAALPRPLEFLAPRHSDGLLGPWTQRLGVLEELVGDLVILHDLAMLAIRPERPHAARFEVRAIGVIDLEVERVIGDQGEKE